MQQSLKAHLFTLCELKAALKFVDYAMKRSSSNPALKAALLKSLPLLEQNEHSELINEIKNTLNQLD